MTDTANEERVELAEYLAADASVLEVETENNPDGEPLDTDQANRFLRRLAILAEAEADAEGQAQREIARIQEWREEKRRRIEADRRWIESALEAFARNEHERTGQQTVNLVNGVLRLRTARENVVVLNDWALVDWLEQNGARDAVRVKKEPDKRAISQLPQDPRDAEVTLADLEGDDPTPLRQLIDCEVHHVVFDGEIVPGVVIARRLLDSFSYKLAES